MGIVKNLLNRDHKAEEELVLPAPKPKETPTPLMLLLPDAGGIATYQHNSFPSARAAEYFLDSTLRGHVPEGAVLFWALGWQPTVNADYGSAAEPLVLIRDAQKPVVYPFSFSDIDGAQDFVRHEMKRGLELQQVMIYWALPARIDVDFWGRSTIIPPSAPVRGFRVEDGDLIQEEERFVPQPQMMLETEVTTALEEGLPESIQEDSDRYLTEADIADVVGLMQELSGERKKIVGGHDGRATRFEPRQPAEQAVSIARASMAVKATAQVIDFTTHRLRARDANVAAWANISLAIDEALDVYVARQVSMKLAWNRLTRALGQAIEAEERKTNQDNWYNGTLALADAVRTEANRQNAAVAGWTNAGNAMAEAVDERKKQIASMALGNFTDGIREGLIVYAARREHLGEAWQTTGAVLAASAAIAQSRKGMRRAWLNISWTMEEAAYAFALEQKAHAMLSWRNATTAIAEAVEAKERYEAALCVCWSNAGAALHEAGEAFFTRQRMFRGVWTDLSHEFRSAAHAQRRHEAVVAAYHSVSQAIGEALGAQAWRETMIETWSIIGDELLAAGDAKARHDAICLAWHNAGEASGEVCRAYVMKQKQAIRAWSRMAIGIKGALEAKFRQDAAILSWTNASQALTEYTSAKVRHEGLVTAWDNTGSFFAEVVVARKHYDILVGAWANAAFALNEAVTEKLRHDGLVSVWNAAGDAMLSAVKASIAKQAGLESAWASLTKNLVSAVEFKHFRERSIAAWHNVGLAMNEVGEAYIARLKAKSAWRNACRAFTEAVPVYERKMAAIAAWTSASIAIKAAIVAEAKMRIAQAGLDKELMAEVDKTVREAQKAVRLANKNGKKADTRKLADVTVSATNGNGNGNGHKDAVETITEQPKLEELAAFMAEPAVEELSTASAEADATFEPIAAETAFESVFGSARHEDEGDTDTSSEADDAGDDSQSSSGRWEPREEPFRGFQSPPGRFYRREREDEAL